MDTSTRGYLYAACLLIALKVSLCLDCSADEYDLNGFRCCSKCPQGQGVLTACSQDSDTVCEPCRPAESFSINHSHEERCEPCQICAQYSYVQHQCNVTHDTECECDRNYYWNRDAQSCRLCELCPLGYGARKKCDMKQNTRCVPCPTGSYSDDISGEGCKLCTRCKPNELRVESCDITHDTICEEMEDKLPPITQPKYDVIHTTPLAAPATSPPGSQSDTKNIVIPVCIGALGLVIIVSIICTVLKCVSNRKTTRQNAKANISYSAVNDPIPTLQQASGMVAKQQGSDSGVSTEQETKSTTRVSELSVVKLQMISGMLQQYTGQWTTFAHELGYTSANIASFEIRSTQLGCPPADIVLSEWSKNISATVEALSQVLLNMDRKDIVQMIYSDSRTIAMNITPNMTPNYYTLQNMQNILQPNGMHMFHANSPATMSQHSMSNVSRMQGAVYPPANNYQHQHQPPSYIQQPQVQPGYTQQPNHNQPQQNYSPAQPSYSQANLVQSPPVMTSAHVNNEQLEARQSPVYIASASSSSGASGVVYNPNQSRGSYQQMHTQPIQADMI